MCFCYCRLEKKNCTQLPVLLISSELHNKLTIKLWSTTWQSDSLILPWLALHLFRNHLTFLSSVSRFVIWERWHLFPVGLLRCFQKMPGHKWSTLTPAWFSSKKIPQESLQYTCQWPSAPNQFLKGSSWILLHFVWFTCESHSFLENTFI